MKNKLNNGGFISTSVLYALFIIILIMLLMVISSYSSTRMILDLEKESIKNYLGSYQDDTGRLVDLIRNVEISKGDSGLFLEEEKSIDEVESKNYYYKGAVDNNWVNFAGLNWRIIRIDENGAIRIILADPTIESEYNSGELSKTIIDSYNDNPYNLDGGIISINNPTKAGYQYAVQEAYGLTNESIAYEKLGDWYKDTFVNSDENFDYTKYIDYDAVYCNNRLVYNSSNNFVEKFEDGYISGLVDDSYRFYHYYTYSNDKSKNHTYKFGCDIEPDGVDFDYVNNSFSSTTTYGNGNLKYLDNGDEHQMPVGLITLDEIIFAGGSSSSNDSYLNIDKKFWTMTPYGFNVGNIWGTSMFIYNDNNRVNYESINSEIYLRPVIALKNSTIVEGDGTYDNPYKVIR